MKKILSVFAIAGVMMLIYSCSKDNGSDNSNGNGTGNPPTTSQCDNVSKTWSNDVSPLISSFCNQAGCHNTGSANGPGPLTNHAQVFAARTQIRDAVQAGRMPQNATLTADQKNKIICWIDSGAPNN